MQREQQFSFFLIFIVIQLQLYAFSPQRATIFNAPPHTPTEAHTHTEKKGPKPGDQGTQKWKQLSLTELQVVLNILSNILYFLNAG